MSDDVASSVIASDVQEWDSSTVSSGLESEIESPETGVSYAVVLSKVGLVAPPGNLVSPDVLVPPPATVGAFTVVCDTEVFSGDVLSSTATVALFV